MANYTGYLGGFDHWHKNPPAPFNPLARKEDLHKVVTDSMVRDSMYQKLSREECRFEWRRRYEAEAQKRDSIKSQEPA